MFTKAVAFQETIQGQFVVAAVGYVVRTAPEAFFFPSLYLLFILHRGCYWLKDLPMVGTNELLLKSQSIDPSIVHVRKWISFFQHTQPEDA